MSAITEEERREFAKALQRFTSKADALLDGNLNDSGNQNVTNVRFDGGRGIVVSLLVGLVGGVCLGVSVFAAVWVANMSTNQQLMNRWMAQEVTAVRSYITTGKLAPMNPPPVGPDEVKKP